MRTSDRPRLSRLDLERNLKVDKKEKKDGLRAATRYRVVLEVFLEPRGVPHIFLG